LPAVHEVGEDPDVLAFDHTVSVDPGTHLVYFPLEKLDAHPVLRIMEPVAGR